MVLERISRCWDGYLIVRFWDGCFDVETYIKKISVRTDI